MSVHITGGTLGFSFGPLLFGPIAAHYGLRATPLLAIPGLLALAFFLTRVPAIDVHPGHRGGLRALGPYARPLSILYLIVVLRTVTSLAFATFVPVMLTRRGLSVSQADATIAAYLFATGIGGFLGGPAADRFGPRRVIALSLIAATPFMVAAPLLSGWSFVIALAAGGMFLQSTLPVNVTFGQMIAPVSAATVSSLMMGFAWGTGGLSVLFVGMIADRIGIRDTLLGTACVPLLAAALALALPRGAPARPAVGRRFPAPEMPEIVD
jgi:FSR family fosmidomycin resistance protein-like MFS transporter